MTWNKKQLFCIKPHGIMKRILCIVMAAWFACSVIVMDYQEAKAAEIVAGYTALEIIEGILLSFGISLFTTEMITTLTEDPETAQDEYWRETQAAFWADQMEAEYENQRKNGNGSGPTPTPDPTGAEIPSFKEVIQNMKNSGKIVLGAAAGAGVWECMSKAVSSLWDKIFQEDPSITYKENPYSYKDLIGSYSITFNCSQLGGFKGTYTYYLYKYNKISHLNLTKYTTPEGYSLHNVGSDSSGLYFNTYSIKRHDYVGREPYISALAGRSSRLSITLPDKSSNVVENINLYVPYTMDGVDYDAKVKPGGKEVIWVHPDLQDTYKNNGKLEYPQEAPQPLQIPSIDQLTELANKLKSDPDQSPDAVQELIDQLQQNPNPQPTTAPNPNPDPQPTTVPNPTTSPDISDGTDTDIDPDKYKTDLRLVFPFCIPFDLIHLLNVFDAEPVAPVFSFPFDLSLKNPFKKGEMILDVHETFEFDFSNLDSVIEIFRITETIGFVIGLMVITRNLIRG